MGRCNSSDIHGQSSRNLLEELAIPKELRRPLLSTDPADGSSLRRARPYSVGWAYETKDLFLAERD